MCLSLCVRVMDVHERTYVRLNVCVYSPVADLSFADVGIIGKRNGKRVLLIRIGNRRFVEEHQPTRFQICRRLCCLFFVLLDQRFEYVLTRFV